MTRQITDSRQLNNSCTINLLLVCILLFGVFHVSYQHDELIHNNANHEQGCEYCSSVGSATVLPTNEFHFYLLVLSHINNVFYEFVSQNSSFYQLHNPRAPPSLG